MPGKNGSSMTGAGRKCWQGSPTTWPPLSPNPGLCSGLQDGIADTPEKQQRYLQKILETTESMAKLNQTLFLFSKLDLDQVPFHWETVDLCACLKDYVEEQKDHWEQNGLQVTLESTLDRAPVKMDRDQFARVLDNLLSNSWKYKTEKTGTAQFHLFSDGQNRVRLELADNGSGVAPDQLDRIFESFYRTDRARSMCPPAAAWDWRWSGKSWKP